MCVTYYKLVLLLCECLYNEEEEKKRQFQTVQTVISIISIRATNVCIMNHSMMSNWFSKANIDTDVFVIKLLTANSFEPVF